MEAIGRRRWAIPEGYIPSESSYSDRELVSHETACILNAADHDAHVTITGFFADREPVGAQAAAGDAADPQSGEGNAIASIDLVKIVQLFDDDPVAQRVVIAMMEGARGQELQDLSGLAKTEYESKRRKIRRRIEKLWLEEEGTNR